jgi:hypothetical protein
LTHMLIAVTTMFLQQTCGSIARALPAVLAPLIIAELHANAAWVGIYFSLTAFAGLIGQLGSGGFIIRHPAIRMSQIVVAAMSGLSRRHHGGDRQHHAAHGLPATSGHIVTEAAASKMATACIL